MPLFSRLKDPGRICVLLAASTGLLWSQGSPVGNLDGTVKYPDGKPAPGLLIMVQTPRGNHQTRTDAQGKFILPQLPPGKVRVIVGAADMEEIRMDVMVVVNQTTALNLKLRKPTGTTVEIVDASTLATIDLDVAKAGKFENMEEIDALPLIDSNRIDSVVNRTPGINANGTYSFNGVDATYNSVNVDGVDVRNGQWGQQGVSLNNEFIDQVQVLTNGISAKYGNFAGGVINVTTKNGTNEFQGTANYEITDPKWDARQKLSPVQINLWGQKPVVPNDQHTTIQSYTFTGPIIKDKVFFAWSLRNQTPTTDTHRVTSAPYFSGVPYTTRGRAYRQDGKLDWQINTDNNVYAEWNQSTSKSTNAGSNTSEFTSLATLPGVNKSETGYRSVGWVSVLRSNLFLDLKLSQTDISSGGAGTGPLGGASVPTWQSTKYSDNYMLLDNGFGSSIKNENKTKAIALNFTWLVDAAGQHSVEFGFQNSKYQQTGCYGSTPSGYTVHFNGFQSYPPASPALQNRNLKPLAPGATYLEWDNPIAGEASSASTGLYVNDAWTLDPHWSFNLGLRYDQFRFETAPEGNRANYNAIDPRISVNYDVQGDTHHVVSLSASIYSAQPMIGDFSGATVTQSPIQRKYAYVGTGGANQGNGLDALLPTGAINWAAWGNLAGQTGQNNAYFTSDPLLNRNVFVDPDVKAPHSKELYLSYHYQRDAQKFSAALVRRWTRDQITETGTGNATTGVATYMLTNDSTARQDYYALLLTYDTKAAENLYLGGNLTWSRNFSNVGQSVNQGPAYYGGNIPGSQLNPYGPTPNQDMPIVVNGDARYQIHVGPGTFNIGTVVTYTGMWSNGFHQGYVMTDPSLVAQGYSSSYMRQYPELGPIWMASFLKIDLQTGYELPVWKTAKAYVKFNIMNLFNYRKSQGPYNSSNVADSTGNPYPSNGSAPDVKYVPDPIYQGTPYFYQDGRHLQLVAGIRF